MTLTEIKNLVMRSKELADAATIDPWFVDGMDVRSDLDSFATDNGIADCTVKICEVYRLSEKLDHDRPNREFIAASREAVPQLCQVISDLLADRERLLEALLAISCEYVLEGEKYIATPYVEIAQDALAASTELFKE